MGVLLTMGMLVVGAVGAAVAAGGLGVLVLVCVLVTVGVFMAVGVFVMVGVRMQLWYSVSYFRVGVTSSAVKSKGRAQGFGSASAPGSKLGLRLWQRFRGVVDSSSPGPLLGISDKSACYDWPNG